MPETISRRGLSISPAGGPRPTKWCCASTKVATVPLSFSFGTEPDIAKALRDKGEVYPEQTVKILDGRVVAELAPLAVPDAYTEGFNYGE
jgi:hypothetical protein